MEKLCPRCTKTKNLIEFNTRNGKPSSYCAKCNSEYNREYRKGKEVERHTAHLKFHYNIPYEWYTRLLKKQNGLCAICKQPQKSNGRFKKLNIDHCHKTDRIRGLLCSECNRAIGLIGDDPEIMLRAYYYLYS